MGTERVRPYAVYSDGKGNIFEEPSLYAVGRSGHRTYPLYLDEMIPLPDGSDLFELPGRKVTGLSRTGELKYTDSGLACAAFIAPAHTQCSIAVWHKEANAPVLPLYAYTAVGWYNGRFYVPALRIDADTRQDCEHFNQRTIIRRGRELMRKHKGNRLVKHLMENCAFTYYCPAARNLAMGRQEAPIPTSPSCNARCIGCISKQDPDESPVPETQHRLNFIPNVDEIVSYVVPHLENAPDAIASFGQGCEGEPLMQWELLHEAIKAIRSRTTKGIINLNTNGSNPHAVEELFKAGLDSIRVSMNSARERWYNLYVRPVGFTLQEPIESLRIARRYGKWSSVNYFVMPGITDTYEELEAMTELIGNTGLNMIQWRNFNIDPDWLFARIEYSNRTEPIGVKRTMALIKERFPEIAYGYFNPGIATIKRYQTGFNTTSKRL